MLASPLLSSPSADATYRIGVAPSLDRARPVYELELLLVLWAPGAVLTAHYEHCPLSRPLPPDTSSDTL